MLRYNLVEGVLVEDPEGEYVKFQDYSTVVNTIKAQISASNAYSVVMQSYVEGLL